LLAIIRFTVFLLCFIFVRLLGADVSAHRAFLFCSVQCHLLSIFCTSVIEQINNDDDDDDDDDDAEMQQPKNVSQLDHKNETVMFNSIDTVL